MKRCSSDARSEGQSGDSSLKSGREWLGRCAHIEMDQAAAENIEFPCLYVLICLMVKVSCKGL